MSIVEKLGGVPGKQVISDVLGNAGGCVILDVDFASGELIKDITMRDIFELMNSNKLVAFRVTGPQEESEVPRVMIDHVLEFSFDTTKMAYVARGPQVGFFSANLDDKPQVIRD